MDLEKSPLWNPPPSSLPNLHDLRSMSPYDFHTTRQMRIRSKYFCSWHTFYNEIDYFATVIFDQRFFSLTAFSKELSNIVAVYKCSTIFWKVDFAKSAEISIKSQNTFIPSYAIPRSLIQENSSVDSVAGIYHWS